MVGENQSISSCLLGISWEGCSSELGAPVLPEVLNGLTDLLVDARGMDCPTLKPKVALVRCIDDWDILLATKASLFEALSRLQTTNIDLGQAHCLNCFASAINS
jgi:hypothetical protein